MTIIVVPTERCNYRCTYCFEPDEQRHGQHKLKYDFEKMKKSLYEVWSGPYRGSSVCLHGGEPLLIGHEEFENLCNLIYNLPWKDNKVKGSVSLVTNGSLIDSKYIDIFKKYNVYVGVSIDGNIDLNLLRGTYPRKPEYREPEHKRVWNNIKRLRKYDIPVSIMCIIHKANADSTEKLKKLGQWMMKLKKIGITSGRVNPMYGTPSDELTNQQLYRTWINVYNWNKKHNLRWNPLIEMENNLRGEIGNHRYFFPKPCTYNNCDPFNTKTLSILPDGTIANCDRTFAHGFYCRSSSGTKSGRYEALAQTECKGCRYWGICGGACPEEGIGGDWRRKTRFCDAIYKTYNYIERDLKKHNPNITLMVNIETPKPVSENKPHGDDPHGDEAHGDAPHGDSTHGDEPHGDAPHADSNHGDNPDWR